MSAKIERKLIEKWGATVLSHENAPGVMASLERLAKEAHMEVPKIYLVDGIPGFGNLGVINAAAVCKDKVVLTKGILKSFGCSNLHGPMDERLEALVGHELSHCQNYGITIAARKVPLLLMPLVAVLGYYFYNRAKDKKTEKEKHEALNKAAKEMEHSVAKENEAPAEHWQKHSIHWGKYIAAAALGLGAGIMMTRGFSHYFELKADMFSKQLMHSGEPLARGLEKLEADTLALLKREGMGKVSMLDLLIMKIFHAHPSTDLRSVLLMR